MTDETPKPSSYAVVLFPGFQALDVFGPVDILNLMAGSKSQPLKLYILAATLDPVPTNLLPGSVGQQVVPTHTFHDPPDGIEVLLIPGGLGTRDDANIGPAVEFIKRIAPSLRYLLTVCTGSAVAAKAGVLDGKRATSNKRALDWVMKSGPDVTWIRRARWVEDGSAWTSSGISAGIDMMYAFVEARYGKEMAEELAWMSEYRRNTDPDDDPFA